MCLGATINRVAHICNNYISLREVRPWNVSDVKQTLQMVKDTALGAIGGIVGGYIKPFQDALTLVGQLDQKSLRTDWMKEIYTNFDKYQLSDVERWP